MFWVSRNGSFFGHFVGKPSASKMTHFGVKNDVWMGFQGIHFFHKIDDFWKNWDFHLNGIYLQYSISYQFLTLFWTTLLTLKLCIFSLFIIFTNFYHFFWSFFTKNDQFFGHFIDFLTPCFYTHFWSHFGPII